jgi:prepilin-type N-terminal cleavage/methylation domain-containing protein
MYSQLRRAFTVIELLVVIAVIAILAAILFPVMGAVREDVRKTTCMSNMHEIYVGAHLFQQDHNRWPCLLLGYGETTKGVPWQPGSVDPLVPPSGITHHFLYPGYVKSIEVFHCPENPDNDQLKVDTPDFPVNSPIYQIMQQKFGHT